MGNTKESFLQQDSVKDVHEASYLGTEDGQSKVQAGPWTEWPLQ